MPRPTPVSRAQGLSRHAPMLVSVLLHLALYLAARVVPEQEPVPRSEPIEIELREARQRTAALEPDPTPPQPPVAAEPVRRRSRPFIASGPASVSPSVPAAVEEEQVAAPDSAAMLAASPSEAGTRPPGAPLAAELPVWAGGGTLALTPSARVGDRLGIGALEGPGAGTTRRAGDPAPDPALQHAREAMEVASHVEEITRRTRGRDRVEKGLVDAYFVEMKQAMERKLQGRDIAAARDPARASLQTFSGAMERFGRTGNPYAEGAGQGPELEALNHAGHVASTPELSQLRAMARFSHEALLGAYAGELTAIVEIRQGRNGRLLELKLRQSSGQLDFDALALEAVPAAMAELVPPESGAGIHADGVHALFAFVGRVVQLPPVMAGGGAATIVGGTFDPALGHLDVRAPGQSRFSCSVRLLEVY